ncbi:hypothetical protein [Streptomyces sp. 150FB]|nr:hypothetical protein [Streptomyces sp. 150FB]
MRIDVHHHLWDLGVRDQPWPLASGDPHIRTVVGTTAARRYGIAG